MEQRTTDGHHELDAKPVRKRIEAAAVAIFLDQYCDRGRWNSRVLHLGIANADCDGFSARDLPSRFRD